MIRRLQYYLHRKLQEHGWLVRRTIQSGGWEAGWVSWDSVYLQRLKFSPATIVDVGVGNGTETLYAAFPNAYLVMVEPLCEFAPAIQETLARRPGVHVPVAAGGSLGQRTMLVEPIITPRSSFYERCGAERSLDVKVPREVPVSTLDIIAKELRFPAPYGLKLDVEGAELEVISGATDLLRQTVFVISEVSVMKRFAGSYSFAELVGRMDQLGFRVCDILDIGRTATSEVSFFDLVFCRRE